MILIIAADEDSHVPYVTRKLDALGANYLHFDPQHFPASASVSVRYNACGECLRELVYRNWSIDFAQIRAVWNRARVRPIPDKCLNSDQTWWVAESCTRFLSELYECIDCLWLPERPSSDREPFRSTNPSDKTRGANTVRGQQPSPHNKLYQLTLAGQLGFILPRTVVTNNPKQLLDFFEACEGQVISKRAIPLATYRDGEKTQSFTREVQRRDLANFQAVRFAPVVFQEKISKKIELRVTVVGNNIFAAEIHSQESSRIHTDWRHYPDYGGGKYYGVHQLPQDMVQRCVQLTRSLGLCFGAIDLIVTQGGDYVFLEINPGGQWAWIEDYTGLPISDAIASLLMGDSP
jgi:hypothetical protein